MDYVLAICAGVGLAGACGFRVFVPLLVTGLSVHLGWLRPSGGMDWIGSWTAIVMFAVATVAEIVAYYVPWVDHALDTVASPGAVAAGTLVAAAAMPDVHPAVKWGAAVVAGGGPAGVVQVGTVLARGVSGVTTAGFGNWVVATVEWVVSVVLAIMAIVLPILAAVLAVWILFVIVRRWGKWKARQRRTGLPAA